MSSKKLLPILLLVMLIFSTSVYAATSSTTLSNSESSATGSYISQGSGNGTLSGTLKSGNDMSVKAMMVIALWPDKNLKTLKATSSNPKVSTSVSLDSPDNWYYVKLEQISGNAEGSGSLSN